MADMDKVREAAIELHKKINGKVMKLMLKQNYSGLPAGTVLIGKVTEAVSLAAMNADKLPRAMRITMHIGPNKFSQEEYYTFGVEDLKATLEGFNAKLTFVEAEEAKMAEVAE